MTMGLEHYFVILFNEGPATNNRESAAVKITHGKLKAFFQFCEIARDTYQYHHVCVFGRMKHYEEGELIDLLQSLPWLMPETLQVLVKSEHDDRYALLEIEIPNGYQPGSTWAGSGDVGFKAAAKKERGENGNE